MWSGGEAVTNNHFPIIPGVITGVLLFCAFMLGAEYAEAGFKEEAVRVGVAYYTNNASGKPEFKWKECK
jgi:hypothetical protein